MQDITKEILAKAAEGDLGSFEIIYRAASGLVYNVAYRIVNNKQDAEEIAQEVFMNIYHNLKNFRLESSIKTWIYRITVNCAINYSRKLSRERDKRQEYYDYVDRRKTFGGPGTDETSDNETVDLFLKTLNPDQRTCIVLRNIEGLSYRQIADTLKININTVRTRLKRAREKLLTIRREVIKNEL
jgi:RNA polymerase sigma-70 factor (ECF subfamily)